MLATTTAPPSPGGSNMNWVEQMDLHLHQTASPRYSPSSASSCLSSPCSPTSAATQPWIAEATSWSSYGLLSLSYGKAPELIKAQQRQHSCPPSLSLPPTYRPYVFGIGCKGRTSRQNSSSRARGHPCNLCHRPRGSGPRDSYPVPLIYRTNDQQSNNQHSIMDLSAQSSSATAAVSRRYPSRRRSRHQGTTSSPPLGPLPSLISSTPLTRHQSHRRRTIPCTPSNAEEHIIPHHPAHATPSHTYSRTVDRDGSPCPAPAMAEVLTPGPIPARDTPHGPRAKTSGFRYQSLRPQVATARR